jgi:hypothetical protein
MPPSSNGLDEIDQAVSKWAEGADLEDPIDVRDEGPAPAPRGGEVRVLIFLGASSLGEFPAECSHPSDAIWPSLRRFE